MKGPLEGRTIAGRYKLEALLGAGSIGSVYRARHLLIERKVAIKVLSLESQGREEYAAWFLREARAVNRVNHPGIADIYDVGRTDDGLVYLVMELVEGQLLSDRLDQGPLDLGLCLDIVDQVALALGRAHGLGVIHRDLKPEHIFLIPFPGGRERVKIIDFGLAVVGKDSRGIGSASLAGTPAYMSPEQLLGSEADHRSDLYSLGVVLYEMATGRRPFPGDDPEALALCHLSEPPADPRLLRPEIAGDLAAVMLKMLAKDPAHRHRDAYHLLDDCRRLRMLRRPPTIAAHDADVVPPQRPNPTLRLDGSSGAALQASLLGRLVSSSYPSGDAPPHISSAVVVLWEGVQLMSRLEGELEVMERWEVNLRQRGRELCAEVGHRIEELARNRSRLERDRESAQLELEMLERAEQSARADLEAFRRQVEWAEDDERTGVAHGLLEAAAATAARHQKCSEGIRHAREAIARCRQAVRRVEEQIAMNRRQLERQTERLEADLDGRRDRLALLALQWERTLATFDGAVVTLEQQLGQRPEAQVVLQEVRRLRRETAHVRVGPVGLLNSPLGEEGIQDQPVH